MITMQMFLDTECNAIKYVNSSESPNCQFKGGASFMMMTAVEDIAFREEITVYYKF